MKHRQEHIAEKLFEKLNTFFGEKRGIIDLHMEGAGVHWNCSVIQNDRKCTIHCFEHLMHEGIPAEYLIDFQDAEKTKAWGRTFGIGEAIYSSNDWVSGKNIDFLYQKYEFVDWYKRRIQQIEKQLITQEEALKQAERELISFWGSDLYTYQMHFQNRSCKLSGFGRDEPLSFEFFWDGTKLFKLQQNDSVLMAEVIKKWLVEGMAPSDLDKQYDWISVGKLAKYYERGEGIKGEFIESWNDMERFYRELSIAQQPFKTDALRLISQMRSMDLDQKLRAGNSTFSLILSRSRRHGLESNKPNLQLIFLGNNRITLNSNLGSKRNSVNMEATYQGALESYVKRLLEVEIK